MKKNTLVVVADGHSATLFRNTDAQAISLSEVQKVTAHDLADSGSGHAPGESSPKDEDEATFAVQLAKKLNSLVLKHKAEEVVIVADPSTLGSMRKAYHKELESRIVKEIAKNLSGSSLADIEKAVG